MSRLFFPKYIRGLGAGFLFLLLNSSASFSETLDSGKTDKTTYNLGDYLYTYEDKLDSKTIDDILKSPADIFQKNIHKYPVFGFSKSAFWAKFSWSDAHPGRQWYLVFDYPLLDTVELYIEDPLKGLLEKRISGNYIPLGQKELKHRKVIFLLQSPGNRTQNIYFKVKSQDTVEIPALLLTNEAYQERESRSSLILGMYYGIVLVMLIYNFFLFLSIRDNAYLNYVALIFSYGVVQAGMDGYLNQYFFPDSGSLANTIRIIFGNFTILFGVRFAESFINIRKNLPGVRKFFLAFYVATLINAVFTIIYFYIAAQVLFVLMMLSAFLFLYISLKLFNKYPPVKLYFFAWSVFILASFVWSLKLFHIYLPGLTQYSLQVGSAIEVTLLSFALGSRINLINSEKEAMKIESLNQRQIMEKNRFQLEMFRKRTQDIESELKLAREIQISMIPSNSAFKNIQGLYLPMDKVGGDFYDIITLDEGRIGIFISDVSGHGIPAALITVMLRSMILSGVNERLAVKNSSWLSDPRKFLIHMNNYLYGHLQGNFITVFYGVYDIHKRTLKYASAAHPPPFLLSGAPGKMSLNYVNVSPQLSPLGLFYLDPKKDDVAVNTLTLSGNDRLILYTDGLMDNVGYDFLNYQTGIESFQGTLLYDIFQQSSGMDLKMLLENISIQLLLSRETLNDDVCILALEAK